LRCDEPAITDAEASVIEAPKPTIDW